MDAGARVALGITLPVQLLVATACSADPSMSSPGQTPDPVGQRAIYVDLATDDFARADQLLDPITKAEQGEPSGPAGFLPGITAVFSVQDVEGTMGLRIIFSSGRADADVTRVVEGVRDLDLEPVVLLDDEFWPDCVGEADCETVAETLQRFP